MQKVFFLIIIPPALYFFSNARCKRNAFGQGKDWCLHRALNKIDTKKLRNGEELIMSDAVLEELK